MSSGQAPKVIGHYELVRVIGQGNSGKVKLAYNTLTRKEVAIKIIRKTDQGNAAVIEKIRREITLQRLMSHPHVLRIDDVLESDNYLYIVTDFATKGELHKYINGNHPYKPDEAMKIFRQIIYGLEYLHSLGVCHRDLKPENLLLFDDDCIKIADFGFARCLYKNMAQTSCGSPHYAAPEVVSGKPYDGRRADVWSCGVILYALVSGKLPFDDPDVRSLLAKVRKGVFEELNVEEDALDLVNGMLKLKPEERFTIEQIKRHPCFRRGLEQTYILPTPIPAHHFCSSSNDYSDYEINELMKLGYNNREELIEDITSEKPNITKIVHQMLRRKNLPYEDVDWSNAALTPPDSAFMLQFSDVLEPMSAPSPESFNSLSVRSMANATQPEWAIHSESSPPSEIKHDIRCKNTSLEEVMAKVQNCISYAKLRWFYPDEFWIYCKHDDTNTLIDIRATVMPKRTIILYITLLDGSEQFLDEFVSQLEFVFEESVSASEEDEDADGQNGYII